MSNWMSNWLDGYGSWINTYTLPPEETVAESTAGQDLNKLISDIKAIQALKVPYEDYVNVMPPRTKEEMDQYFSIRPTVQADVRGGLARWADEMYDQDPLGVLATVADIVPGIPFHDIIDPPPKSRDEGPQNIRKALNNLFMASMVPSLPGMVRGVPGFMKNIPKHVGGVVTNIKSPVTYGFNRLPWKTKSPHIGDYSIREALGAIKKDVPYWNPTMDPIPGTMNPPVYRAKAGFRDFYSEPTLLSDVYRAREVPYRMYFGLSPRNMRFNRVGKPHTDEMGRLPKSDSSDLRFELVDDIPIPKLSAINADGTLKSKIEFERSKFFPYTNRKRKKTKVGPIYKEISPGVIDFNYKGDYTGLKMRQKIIEDIIKFKSGGSIEELSDVHAVMGGYNLKFNPKTKSWIYEDKWDFKINEGELRKAFKAFKEGKEINSLGQEVSIPVFDRVKLLSHRLGSMGLRKSIDSIIKLNKELKPVTIRGEILDSEVAAYWNAISRADSPYKGVDEILPGISEHWRKVSHRVMKQHNYPGGIGGIKLKPYAKGSGLKESLNPYFPHHVDNIIGKLPESRIIR